MNKTVNIRVGGMSCVHCEKTVCDTAVKVEGGVKAKASAKKNLLTVKVKGNETVQKVKEAVRKTDFEVLD